MNVILIGPQGSGKGTQADLIAERMGLVKISTGDLFRSEIKASTEIGKQVQTILERGELVPDETTLSIVEERLDQIQADGKAGAVFDGFPRTKGQAEGLDHALRARNQQVDNVIELRLAEIVLIHRLSGRRVCSECGRGYHLESHPPAVPGVCDHCGGSLTQRSDDTAESIHRRLALYAELTAPLLDYYRHRGIVELVDADQSVDDVARDIAGILMPVGAEGTTA